MNSMRKITGISGIMLVVLCAWTLSVHAEPCFPSTPFDTYAMEFLTRAVPGIQLVQTSPGMHVILVGTGMPWFDPIRNTQCIAVIAGGKFILLDTGDGCTETLEGLNLPVNLIDHVFLTHYHSDHVNGLGHLISHTWVSGRQQPIHVHGPKGIHHLMAGIEKASSLDIDLRTSFSSLDPDLAVGVPHQFKYPKDGSPVEVWSENGVVVEAFKNDHYDVEISCGYRVTYAGRVIVISGDTIYSQAVIDNATDADLLIHEATNKAMAERAACLAETMLGPQGEYLATRIRRAIEHHIDTPQVAEVAALAGVKSLILTHILPQIPESFSNDFMDGMDAMYADGPIYVAKDGDSFYLPPMPSDDIVGPCNGPCTP